MRPAPRTAGACEDGSILALVGLLVATGLLVLVLLVDLTAYLVAASRAQAAADAAALAAVTVADPRARAPGDPAAEAGRVAAAAGAAVETCACPPGARRVRVTVSVPVNAVVVTRLAARRVTAEAEAELRPAEPPGAPLAGEGPGRRRAGRA